MKNYFVILLIFLGLNGHSQSPEVFVPGMSSYPEDCREIGFFAQTVLDSSYFFKSNVVEFTTKLVDESENINCEYFAQVLTILGFHKFISNDILESRTALLKADSIFQTFDDYENRHYIRNKIFLSLNYNVADDTIKSLRYLKEGEAVALKINDEKMLADVYQNIGTLYLNCQMIDEAKYFTLKAIDYAEKSGNLEIVGFANVALSRISRYENDWLKAMKYVETARLVFVKLEDKSNLYIIEYAKGEIHKELKENEKAIEKFNNALSMGDKSNHKFQHGIIYKQLGEIFKEIDIEKSVNYYEKALQNYAVLNENEFSTTVEYLNQNYLKTKNHNKLNLLVNNLMNFSKVRREEIKVELLESNQSEIEIQKEINKNEILKLKDSTNRKRFFIILFAALICLAFALFAIAQASKNKRLSQKISKQNTKLQNQNTELKNFASIASHDLKAPAQSIASFATLLEKRLPKASDSEIFKFLDIIKTSSNNMNKLVKSLEKFSTLENLELDVSSINTTKLIEEVGNNLFSYINARNGKLKISSDLPKTFYGDEALIKIVFQNLISNALKFVEEGVVPVVDIDYDSDNTFHFFKFSDNGIGIAEENLKKIFLIFERLHSSKDYEGSGIGLATCQRIMKLHNGTMSVESKVNKGSTFTLSMPKKIDLIKETL